jgi:hypothetical protein
MKKPTHIEHKSSHSVTLHFEGGIIMVIDKDKDYAMIDGRKMVVTRNQNWSLHGLAIGRYGDQFSDMIRPSSTHVAALRAKLSALGDYGIATHDDIYTIMIDCKRGGSVKNRYVTRTGNAVKITKVQNFILSDWQRDEVIRLKAKQIKETHIAALLKVPMSVISKLMKEAA